MDPCTTAWVLCMSTARFTTVQFILDSPDEIGPSGYGIPAQNTEESKAVLIQRLAGMLDGTNEVVGTGLLTTYFRPFFRALLRPSGSFGLAQASRYDGHPSYAEQGHKSTLLPLVRIHIPSFSEWSE